jgi:hypothetical protein
MSFELVQLIFVSVMEVRKINDSKYFLKAFTLCLLVRDVDEQVRVASFLLYTCT